MNGEALSNSLKRFKGIPLDQVFFRKNADLLPKIIEKEEDKVCKVQQIMSAQMEIDRNNQEEEKRKRLANRCFQDIPYLTRFPLVNPCAVLDYFSHSPFFDPSSNNQRLIMQGMLQSMENLEAMRTGLEFVVNESLSRPPNLFVIQKQNRKSPKQAESVEVYYCLNGSIFQSPDLLEVIRCRFAKIVTSLGKAHDCLFEEDTEVHD